MRDSALVIVLYEIPKLENGQKTRLSWFPRPISDEGSTGQPC